MEVLGVDFSGAKSDKNTWMAKAFLTDEGLTLQECRPLSRSDLTDVLTGMTAPSIAALDFPFSVPLSFVEYWRPSAKSMPDLWKAASSMELAEFIKLRDEFVAFHGEPKRLCDTYFPESYSCLHKTNPNMVPMTFYGMKMLHSLWNLGCDVPPLPSQNSNRPVLLETMPGAALRAFGLPYKGYKNGSKATLLRKQILDGLCERSSIRVRNLDDFRNACLASHDCLDAVVAAAVAAIWAKNPCLFRLPTSEEMRPENGKALIEGWLYAPVFLRQT